MYFLKLYLLPQFQLGMPFCVTAIRLLRNKHQYRAPKLLSAAYFRSGSGSGSDLHGSILAVFLPQVRVSSSSVKFV